MVNVDGTLTVFEVGKRLGVKRILLPSTIATFSSDVRSPISDYERQRPKTIYGITKVFCELVGEYYHQKYGIDFRSLRLPSVIGPGRVDGGVSVYASLMIELPAKGLPYEVHAAPRSSIPLLYIEDAINAVDMILEEASLRQRIYNVGGITPTAEEIAAEVRKNIPGAKIRFRPKPEAIRILKQWHQMDSSNLERDLGWKIQYTLARLVPDFIRKLKS